MMKLLKFRVIESTFKEISTLQLELIKFGFSAIMLCKYASSYYFT